jgi:predicted nuclease with TOPRIM domain
VDESVDIDTVDVNSCKEKFEEVKEYLNNVIIEKDNLAIENEQYKFYNRESSEKDLIYITVNISNLSQDQKYLAENFKMKTNDSGWKIQILNV